MHQNLGVSQPFPSPAHQYSKAQNLRTVLAGTSCEAWGPVTRRQIDRPSEKSWLLPAPGLPKKGLCPRQHVPWRNISTKYIPSTAAQSLLRPSSGSPWVLPRPTSG